MVKYKALRAFYNHYIKPKYPICGVLYLTNKCNLKCDFCEIGHLNRVNKSYELLELTIDEIDLLVESLCELGVPEVYITGGEPFMSRNLWYLLTKCSRNGIAIEGITTNGSMFEKLDAEKIQQLNASCVRSIIISVDHVLAGQHDNLRGKTDLLSGIEAFLLSDKANDFDNKFIISTVVTKNNYREIPDIIAWVAKVGKIKHINFQPVCCEQIFPDMQIDEGSKDTYRIEASEISELYEYLHKGIKDANFYKLSTNLDLLSSWIGEYFLQSKGNGYFFDKVLKKHHCSKPYNYVHVNYNGDVMACTHLGPLFNIKDGNIVNNWIKAANNYRKLMREHKYVSICKSCFCDFPHNLRYSLLYSPIANFNFIRKIVPYYIKRIINRY